MEKTQLINEIVAELSITKSKKKGDRTIES